MKSKLFFLLLLLNAEAFAQTTINKTITVQPGQMITMNFDYPQLIKISTWDKNEISITGTVSINEGENDDAFLLETSSHGNEISITGKMKDMESLPHRITIKRDGKKIIFKTKADYNKYADLNGRDYNSMSWGPAIDIFLEIKVPSNKETKVFSVYGTIEVKDFRAPLIAQSTYGGVDVVLTEKEVGDLKAATNYGQIFTNLDQNFKEGVFEDFHTVVSAKLGSGPRYSVESKYGNVYLRKAL